MPPLLHVFASYQRTAFGGSAASRKAQGGFTLLELAVTLTIIAVLAGMGISSWAGLTQREAVKGQVSALVGAMRFARSEAIKKNARVVICPRDLAATPISSTYPCNTTTGAGWENGWIIFVDQNASNQYDASETLLKEQGSLSGSGGITMNNGSSNGDRIVFRNSGILFFGASNIKFLPTSQDSTRGSMVCISLQGRTRVVDITPTCPS